MAYLGVDPNVGDITFQKFTGNGSATSFTLAQNVASGEAILVTVANVVQEPGASASYTANGTTLEFSSAPANDAAIVVRFFGRAVDQPLSFAMQIFKYVATSNQTAFTGADSAGAVLAFGSDVDIYLNGVHLDTTDFTLSGGDTITLASGATANDELVVRSFRAFAATDTVSKASGGAFTGAVTATGGLNVSTVKDASATTTAMTIDSSGRILTPARPAFLATITTTHTIDASSYATVDYNTNGTEQFDIGSCFDKTNNKFIAPVAGIYQFNISLRVDNITANDYVNMGLRTPSYSGNGQGTSQSDIVFRSAYVLIGSPSTDYQSITASTILQCTASQEIEHWVRTESDTSIGINDRGSMFSGVLIG